MLASGNMHSAGFLLSCRLAPFSNCTPVVPVRVHLGMKALQWQATHLRISLPRADPWHGPGKKCEHADEVSPVSRVPGKGPAKLAR